MALLDLTGLTLLDLSDNQLDGTIPSTIGQLTRLIWLDLGSAQLRSSNNKLKGSIPTAIGQLTQLNNLDFGYNSLTGSVPTELLELKQLTSTLGLQGNSLTGLLPGFNFTKIALCCRMDGEVSTRVWAAHNALVQSTILLRRASRFPTRPS
jgi:Leucine-rich repeat (LRR) protein